MNFWLAWHGDIVAIVGMVATLIGGWLFGARYTELSNRRRDYNEIALRVRDAIRPALQSGFGRTVADADWDHLLHLLGGAGARTCQQARDDYDRALRDEWLVTASGRCEFRDKDAVLIAARRWFDCVPLR